MIEFFSKLFSMDFMPHGYCLRLPEVIWLHQISDLVIAFSYFLIPLALIYLVRVRRDLIYPWMFWLFGLFILSCGMTHVLAVYVLWNPVYRLDGLVKAVTAMASLPTALLLFRLVPKVKLIPSATQLREQNEALVREVTERVKAEEDVRRLNAELEMRVAQRTQELADANAFLRTILDSSPDLIAAKDKNGAYIALNQATAKMIGKPEHEILGKTNLAFNEAPIAEVFMAVDRQVIETGKAVEVQEQYTDPEGELHYFNSIRSPLMNQNGTTQGVVVVARDITQQRFAEQALKDSENKYRTLMVSLPQLVWECDADGLCVFQAPQWQVATGQSAEDSLGWGWLEMVHPEERGRIASEWNRQKFDGKYEVQYKLRSADGPYRRMIAQAAALYDAAGAIRGWVGSTTNVEDAMIAADRLRSSEERFVQLADNISQFAWMADETGWFFWFNQRWYDYSGTTIEEMQGWGWQSLHHPDHLDRVLAGFKASLATGEVWEDTFPLRGKTGEWRWFLSRARPIRDEDGKITRWFGTNTDITEQREVEAELRRANSDLEQFAYSASHDLKEPLRNLSIYCELLGRRYSSHLDEQGLQFLGFIQEGASRISTLIADLLAYTQIRSIEETANGWTDSQAALDQVVSMYRPTLLALNAEVRASGMPNVRMSEVHLVQIFQNLIGNALKYRQDHVTPNVEVRAERLGHFVQFSVRDNGIGIHLDYRESIFGIFKRLHTQEKYSGSGMGLAICKRIVERYGGRIWVESEPGKGSTFYFTVQG